MESKYSTFEARVIAGLLDGLVFAPLIVIDRFIDSPEDGVGLFLIWSAIAYSAVWLYSVLFHTLSGQTLGKRAVGVKVLDISETRTPTLLQAVLRDSVYIALNTAALCYLVVLVVSGRYTETGFSESWLSHVAEWIAGGWFAIEVVTMLMNSKRRALHDFIARTVVVHSA